MQAIADQIHQNICNAFPGVVSVTVKFESEVGWIAYFKAPGTMSRVCGIGQSPPAVLASARIAVCAARSAESEYGPGCFRMRPGQVDDSGYSRGKLLP